MVMTVPGVRLTAGFALLLIPALAGGADQQLTAAAFGVVDMPVVPAARLKGDIGQEHRALSGSVSGFRYEFPMKYWA